MKTLFRKGTTSLSFSVFALSCGANGGAGDSLDPSENVEDSSGGSTQGTGASNASGGTAPGTGGDAGATGGGTSTGGTGTGGVGAGTGGATAGTGGSTTLGTVCIDAEQADCDKWVKSAVLYEEKFEQSSLDNWIAELESPESSVVRVNSGQLDVDVDAGATIWFKHAIDGNVSIEYEVTMVDEGGANDRVSDLNQFWKAVDPNNPNLFTRDGGFAGYDNLLLYYVGKGGNNNTTTRFRKYPGDGSRDVLAEYLDSEHLLVANKTYHIKIRCFGPMVQYLVDDQLYFSYLDPDPIPEGHFAFRTVRSHAWIDEFIVYRLDEVAP